MYDFEDFTSFEDCYCYTIKPYKVFNSEFITNDIASYFPHCKLDSMINL